MNFHLICNKSFYFIIHLNISHVHCKLNLKYASLENGKICPWLVLEKFDCIRMDIVAKAKFLNQKPGSTFHVSDHRSWCREANFILWNTQIISSPINISFAPGKIIFSSTLCNLFLQRLPEAAWNSSKFLFLLRPLADCVISDLTIISKLSFLHANQRLIY